MTGWSVWERKNCKNCKNNKILGSWDPIISAQSPIPSKEVAALRILTSFLTLLGWPETKREKYFGVNCQICLRHLVLCPGNRPSFISPPRMSMYSTWQVDSGKDCRFCPNNWPMRPSLVSGGENRSQITSLAERNKHCKNISLWLFLSVICERERNLSRRQYLYLDGPVMAIFIWQLSNFGKYNKCCFYVVNLKVHQTW